MARILIIDDDQSILESLEMYFVEKGHTIGKAATGRVGLELFRRQKPDIVILDIRLPDESGMELLKQMQDLDPISKVIMITAFQDMKSIIDSMKEGAYDYIQKPLDIDEVERVVNQALQVLEVDRETAGYEEIGPMADQDVIVGASDKMRQIFKMIGLLCRNTTTVLIQGETGTGKELVARSIHLNSPYHGEPFVVLDCSSIVETLIESELFGHEKGAFTGAGQAKPGKIELAGRGTLFLDEIGELPLSLQSKFLGFLQRREYMRIGGQTTLQSNCRIIAATNRDLSGLVQKGQFKEDLYYRLRVVTLDMPPLRERVSDIPELVNHFLQKITAEFGSGPIKLQKGVLERLTAHSWVGNVRELENVLVEAAVRAQGKVILLEEIDRILVSKRGKAEEEPGDHSLPRVEKKHIENILASVEGNRTRAARILGISLPTLRSKIQKYRIVSD
ncbi:MAG: sigma-54 dependent transcriptional regulator [Desulfohalobiaceae bacterium]|nr:sigma-54 dependent transcriptional regulator [Desulfohalobiaceae bacterium]